MFPLNGYFVKVKHANLGLWCCPALCKYSEETLKTLVQSIGRKLKLQIKGEKIKRKKKKSREVQVLSFLFVFVKLYPQFTAMLMSRLQQQWQDLITFSTFSKHWELLNAELV